LVFKAHDDRAKAAMANKTLLMFNLFSFNYRVIQGMGIQVGRASGSARHKLSGLLHLLPV
jgi:hypothetical protein